MPKKSQKNSTMEELLSEAKLPTLNLRRGDVVEGTVLTVSERDALIDIGAKSEGILPMSEFKGRKLSPQDKILVYVLTPEDKKGQIRLSLKRARAAKAWLDLQAAVDSQEVLECTITGHNKGGLTVDILGQNGFIPFSHLENPPDLSLPRPELQSTLDRLRGEPLRVVCLEADPAKDRVILSERLALHAQEIIHKKKVLAKLKVGETLDGQVLGVLPYGVSVEVLGAEGLAETEELAWDQPEADLAKYEIGQEVKVKVLSVDEKTGKVRLSVKQTQTDPWVERVRNLKPGSKLKGEVIKISSQGILLRLKENLEGLLPLGALPTDKKEVKIGEKMEVVVDEIDLANRSLNLKSE